MSDINEPNSIGNPEPVESGRDWGIFDPIPNIVALFGGIVAVAMLAAPTRLAGSTHSAKLKWQQRQAEIQRVIATEAATDGSYKSAPSANE
jgi:hypothetical protein